MTQQNTLTPPELLLHNFQLLTMADRAGPYGLIPDGAVAIQNGEITWVGSCGDENAPTPAQSPSAATRVIHGQGRFLSPGLIDCHTHLVWGGSRADEWEMRLRGASYQQIAQQGGGILSTVQATRQSSEEQLYAAARRRIEHLMAEGVTTLEIKSGYGLDIETECKILRVATDLRDSMPVDVQRTFLGAHAVPREYSGNADQYLDLVCGDMLAAVRPHCEAVDVFCEGIGFDLKQTRRVFQAAQTAGLALKVHAEQLSLMGGARLAAEMGGLSADHLEYLDEASIRVMASQGTVAVLLPGAFYFIHETQRPPIALLRQYQVPIAIASDANPGSSPTASLLLMMNMACTLFRLTPEEALAGVTRHAAQALNLQARLGTIEVGKQADLVIWDIQSPAELAYGIGHNPCHSVIKKGEMLEYQR